MSLQNGGLTSDDAVFIRVGRFYFREDAICEIESFPAPDGTIVGAIVYRLGHEVPVSVHGADAQDLIDQITPAVRARTGTRSDELRQARTERDERQTQEHDR